VNSVTDIRERLAFETADVSVHSITTLLVGLLMISGNRLKKKNSHKTNGLMLSVKRKSVG
jgi:hypothetical protein